MIHTRSVFILISFCMSILHTSIALSEPTEIGVLLCQTGPCAEWGTNAVKGIRLALDEINAEKTKFTIQLEDSEDMNPSKTISAFYSLKSKVSSRVIIGPSWSVSAMALSPLVAKSENFILISPTVGVREYNESSDRIFNVWPHDDVSSSALARRAFEKGHTSISIITPQHPWEYTQSVTFRDAYKKAGGTVIDFIEYDYESSDMKSLASKLSRKKPDAILLGNYNHMGVFSRELRKFNYTGQLYTILMDKTQVALSKGALEGIEFAQYPEASVEFKTSFEKKYGESPGVAADTAYDAMHLIAKTYSDDKVQMKESLLATKKYQGASGEISFDEKGGIYREPIFVKLQGEDFVPVKD